MERARNVKPLRMLGDPERWGATQTLQVVAGVQQGVTIGQQFIRAQAANLVAVDWDIVCTTMVTGISQSAGNYNDDVLVGLLVTFGVGQATSRLGMQILQTKRGTPFTASISNPAATTNGFVPQPLGAPFGSATVQLALAQTAYPLPANSIAIQAFIQAVSTQADHTLTAIINAQIAPRNYPV